MRPVIIWAPPWDPTSGGIIVLHRLCHELRLMGQEAYVSTSQTNPNLNTPYLTYTPQDYAVIYPEIVFGNPFNAPHIIRWVLNNPGKLGGPTEYGPEEKVYTFSKLFYDTDNVLMLPPLDLETFNDKKLKREKAVCYVGKGHKTPRLPITEDLFEITRSTAEYPLNLANILNTATVMYCYDNITAMADIARLCGCPVCIIPNGEYTKDEYHNISGGWNGLSWDMNTPILDVEKFRDDYKKLDRIFHKRLKGLIKDINK